MDQVEEIEAADREPASGTNTGARLIGSIITINALGLADGSGLCAGKLKSLFRGRRLKSDRGLVRNWPPLNELGPDALSIVFLSLQQTRCFRGCSRISSRKDVIHPTQR